MSILIWHRVLPALDPMFPGELHAARFDTTLAWIRHWFNVLPLSEAVQRMLDGRLPERAAAISFDDGYADNLTVAAPLLAKHGLPATVFIAAGYLDGGRMWNDGLIEAVRRSPLAAIDVGEYGRYTLEDWPARTRAALALIDKIKYLEPIQRERAVFDIACVAKVELPNDLMLSSAQVRELHRSQGVTLGAHTITHPILARISDSSAHAEIAGGRQALQSLIDAPVDLFAYPNGKPGQDYTRKHVDLVRELGFTAAVSTAWGASRSGDDYFQLRRFTPWDNDRLRFGLRMMRNLTASAQQSLV
ncbi:MAG: polysaccharide deacetylase family protein [Betaproteobacteria bacterium]|nr:polysaccharide deacetylase family protein [Betaproteobacteria bacterium]